jgi:hypothetical protein
MPFSEARGDGDSLFTTYKWRKLREQIKKLRQPCWRCGQPIDYAGPKYFIVNGKRKQNPRSFVLGHVVSRREARAAGWSEARINAPSNLQAECLGCSNSSGASLGRRLQEPTRVIADRW